MKIEKISDTQIKFILNKSDLNHRNIKLSELAYGSEKTQELFHEMMEQALLECGFQSENTPLMIEAIPVTLDSIMVIVTKVSNIKEIESKFNLLPSSRSKNKIKDDIPFNDDNNQSNIHIYSFNTLEDTISLCFRLQNKFTGLSSLYKNNSYYFLILENTDTENKNLGYILSEYGKKHISNLKSKYYLIEHGEQLIKESAVEILSKI